MIVVTGAGGTVGSELVKRLSASGARFRAAYNSPGKLERARREGIDAVGIDYASPATVAAALEGADRLFLLAAGGAGQAEAEIGVVGEAQRRGVAHIVKLSVWRAEEEGYSFAKVHRTVEREIESSGIAWTFLRPNGFMQNLATHFAGSIRSQGAFHVPSRGCRISHVDVRDIAAVAAEALTRPGHEGKAYLLSGPAALTYAEIAERLSAAIGRRVAYVDVPDEEFREGALRAGMPEAYADALLSLIHYYEQGRACAVTPDVERVTGNRPIPFERFARDHAGAFL